MKTRWQVSLRTLATFILLSSFGLSMLASWIHQASATRRSVVTLEKLGSDVLWDVDCHPKDKSQLTQWLVRTFGKEYFGSVISVEMVNASDAHFGHLRHLPSLTHLTVDAVDVGPEAISELSHSQHLKSLILRGAGVVDKTLSSLPALPQLEHLGFYDTGVQGEGFRHLESQPRLRALVIHDHDIDDESIMHLQTTRQLNSVSFGGTRVTKDGAGQLFTALKECDVIVGPRRELATFFSFDAESGFQSGNAELEGNSFGGAL